MSDIKKMAHTIQEVEANPGLIDETYTLLNGRHNILYQFVMRYDDYIYNTHDYGTGDALTMIESHTLSFIDDHPGTTVTELASFWSKTKGAISQIVSRLERYGLIEKRKAPDNGKTVLLYATETVKKASTAHKMYDILDITKTMGELGKECSPDDIDTFFRVLSVYNDVITRDFEENNISKRQGRRKHKK